MPEGEIGLLLVEDNPGDARMVEAFLRAPAGPKFMVYWAECLADALAIIARGGLDVVLLDLSLPDSHGMSTLSRTRREAPELPIIVLTGVDDDALGMQLIQAGAQDYLTKNDINGQLLRRAVRYAIERNRSEQWLREAYARLRDEIAQREAAEAEAQEANQAKDQFVALVSHELRNPLSAMTAGVDLLRFSVPQEGRSGRALEILDRSVKLQARLVNDLLDLSRIQRGKLQLQRAPVALDKVVATCQACEPEAGEAGLTLTCDVEPNLWVQGDLDRLQQVVMNLVSNAVKFTPAGGSVGVTVRRSFVSGRERAASSPTPPLSHSPTHGEVATILVEDTGIGISPELLPDLFEMFHQGEVAGQRKPGLGLGLALVKGIVERHGGRVWAESDGPGRGSRFLVELPLVAGPAVSVSPRRRFAPSPLRILLIEDNADTRSLISDALTVSGYEVRPAGSGEAGLEILSESGGMREWESRDAGAGTAAPSRPLPHSPTPPLSHSPTYPPWRPDVILCDIGLPGMDGNEFVRRARRLPGMADVLAFAVTGYGAEEDVRRGREAGFAGHFVKPVNVAALDQRIREWVGAVEAS